MKIRFKRLEKKGDRLLAIAACGCKALVKEAWIKEYEERKEAPLFFPRPLLLPSDEASPEEDKAFLVFLEKRVGRGHYTERCSLHWSGR